MASRRGPAKTVDQTLQSGQFAGNEPTGTAIIAPARLISSMLSSIVVCANQGFGHPSSHRLLPCSGHQAWILYQELLRVSTHQLGFSK